MSSCKKAFLKTLNAGLKPIAHNARAMKHEKATVEDVGRVDKLFMDIGEAADHLKKYEEKLVIR